MTAAVRRHKDLAALLLSKGKLPAALGEYRAILDAVPGELAVRQKVAEILVRLGKVDEAVAQYGEAVRRYAEEGLFFKAVALSRVILALDPTHLPAQQLLADLYAQRHHGHPAPAPVRNPPLEPEATALDTHAIALAYVKVVTTRPVEADHPDEVAITPEDLPREAEVPPPPRAALPQIPLFSSLSKVEFLAVLNGALETRTWPAGAEIVTEGDPGGSMYAVAQGRVSVWRKSRQVALLREGAFFGEMALLSGAERMATVRADTDVVLLEFPRESMDRIIAHHPGVRAGLEQFFRDRLLSNLMRANPLLQLLNLPQRAALSAAFRTCGFGPNEVVLGEGASGAAVFLLLRGRCGVSHQAPDGSTYPDLEEGDAFGEISVLTRLPASATVRTRTPVMALRVAAEDFRTIVMANPEVTRRVQELAAGRLAPHAKMQLRPGSDHRV